MANKTTIKDLEKELKLIKKELEKIKALVGIDKSQKAKKVRLKENRLIT